MVRKAFAMYVGTRSGEGTRSDHLVMRVKRSTCSISCSEPFPALKLGAAPPSSSTGLLAAYALAIPVSASVTPGPAVTAQTPIPRVSRAVASAAWAAACSCRVSISWMPSSTHAA